VLAVVTVLALAAGMATSALFLRLARPEADGAGGGAEGGGGLEPGRPDRVELGPLSIALPAELGPWSPVSGDVFDPVRSGSSTTGLAVEGAWGVLAPGGLVVTVMTVTQGSHRGVAGLTGPFDGAAALDVPWPGPGDHVAGQQVTDGMRELLLAAELDGGQLAVLSVSGPAEMFVDGALERSFATVRPGG
jgi:hypothetical protein